MSLSLERICEILNIEFGEPYLVENGVYAKIEHVDGEKILNLQIGRRDCQINEAGIVIGAGTLMSMPDDVLVFNDIH